MYKVLRNPTGRDVQKTWSSYLFIFLILYISNDTFLFGSNASSIMVSIPRWFSLSCILICFLSILLRGKIHLKKKSGLSVLLLFVVFQLANYFFCGSTIQIVLVQLVFIFFAYLIVQTNDQKIYFDIYTEIMEVFAIASISIFILNVIAPGILRIFPVVINTSGTAVNHILLGVADVSSGVLLRSRGIFWEPGTYAIYLLLAIMKELFSNDLNIKRAIILVTALLLTFSTAGYISCAYLLLVWMISKNVSNRMKTKLFLFLMGALLLTSPFLGPAIEEMFINKLAGGILSSTHGSTVARLASFVLNTEIAFENPLIGVGLTDINNIFIEKSIEFFGVANRTNANTNTIMFKFAAHGLIYGSLVVIGIWKFFCKMSKTRSKLVKTTLFVFVFILFAGENLQNSILPYVLVFYGMTLGNVQYNYQNREVILDVH